MLTITEAEHIPFVARTLGWLLFGNKGPEVRVSASPIIVTDEVVPKSP